MLASTQLSDGWSNPLLEVPSVALLQHYVLWLLGCFMQLLALRCKLSPHTMHSAERLICAAVQHSCRCLELLPDQTAPSPQFLALSASAFTAASFLLKQTAISAGELSQAASSRPNMAVCSELQPQHVFMSQEMMICGCSLLLLALCQQQQQQQLKQGSDDSQECSSSIWQYACTQHSRLPQPYLQLCRALGWSSRAFLYVACSSHHITYSGAELDRLIFDFIDPLDACKTMLQAQQRSQGNR